jgi:putative sterol carrier protein
MSTILHSAAQAVGWVFGLVGALLAVVVMPGVLKKAFTNSITKLSLKQQHRLFQDYYGKLQKKECYEELKALDEVLIAYQNGQQPTRKQLKPYKLVVKKKLKLKGDDFKFITTRYITRTEP